MFQLVLVLVCGFLTGAYRLGSGIYVLTTINELRANGVRVLAEAVAPPPDAPSWQSRRRGGWVFNPLLSWVTADGRTVRQQAGSKHKPVRVREGRPVTVFHEPDAPAKLWVEGSGVKARACIDIGFGIVVIMTVLFFAALSP
ncbi:DUF3592 domain-containing protein [Streptomyces sp. NPDC048172]|uniref:DUF3592 domain-containing protein n=1 Tax=Streptomyces sp. NPDC048172 TaxID=3365505 RepID=UPI00371C0C62